MPPRREFRPSTDPRSLSALLEAFLEWLQVRNYSPCTITTRRRCICFFLDWAEQRGLHHATEISRPILERFQRHLFHFRKQNGDPLTFRSQHNYLTSVRPWFKWMARQNHILYNPAAEIELPRLELRLPRHVLSAKEAEQVLNQADVRTPEGIRDRAIMEVLYSTGMRRLEVAHLNIFDLDAERGVVMVRQGKGRKDRCVPIGERAIAWVQRYLHEVRPSFVVGGLSGSVLFLTDSGRPVEPERLTNWISSYVTTAQTGKTGSCHLFRHTVATLMLENGADIRYIQAMLGHARLDTTQIYTQVSIQQLKAVHEATHPARLHRKKDSDK